MEKTTFFFRIMLFFFWLFTLNKLVYCYPYYYSNLKWIHHIVIYLCHKNCLGISIAIYYYCTIQCIYYSAGPEILNLIHSFSMYSIQFWMYNIRTYLEIVMNQWQFNSNIVLFSQIYIVYLLWLRDELHETGIKVIEK